MSESNSSTSSLRVFVSLYLEPNPRRRDRPAPRSTGLLNASAKALLSVVSLPSPDLRAGAGFVVEGDAEDIVECESLKHVLLDGQRKAGCCARGATSGGGGRVARHARSATKAWKERVLNMISIVVGDVLRALGLSIGVQDALVEEVVQQRRGGSSCSSSRRPAGASRMCTWLSS